MKQAEFPVKTAKDPQGMTLQDELVSVERGFWTGDTEYYKLNLDDECITVFTPRWRASSRVMESRA